MRFYQYRFHNWAPARGDEETVLAAVNLGQDTDTTAAIAGGLAGILYGFDSIPTEWVNQLARLNDVLQLCDDLNKRWG